MRFAFGDDQLLFRDTVRDLFDKACRPDDVRAAWAGDGRLPDVWAALADMGVLGLQVPDAHGGLGLNELDLVLVLEETGRADLPDPIVDVVAVAAPLLAEVASPELQERWLPAVVAGDALVTTAFSGPFVPHADTAAIVLAERDGRLVAVPPTVLRLERQASVDGSRRLFDVEWPDGSGEAGVDEAGVDEVAVVLAEGDEAALAVSRALDRGAVATAAQLVGLSRQMLDLTVGYVKERHQFGVPIGSFQAVKHHLADALLGLEFAAPVVHAAAYALAEGGGEGDAGPEVARAVSHAKVAANDAARLVGRQALQCHGAIGYTVEYDLHLALKRVWALSESYGSSAWHRRRVADLVLGPIPS
jgi:alkylation response protein AidB-like acyl-CoA dehydrogenase